MEKNDLISRSNLLLEFNKQSKICETFHISAIEAVIESAPCIDNQKEEKGHWIVFDECANEGVYCSKCHKKVYKKQYANQALKSEFCPGCGSIMDGKEPIDV